MVCVDNDFVIYQIIQTSRRIITLHNVEDEIHFQVEIKSNNFGYLFKLNKI